MNIFSKWFKRLKKNNITKLCRDLRLNRTDSKSLRSAIKSLHDRKRSNTGLNMTADQLKAMLNLKELDKEIDQRLEMLENQDKELENEKLNKIQQIEYDFELIQQILNQRRKSLLNEFNEIYNTKKGQIGNSILDLKESSKKAKQCYKQCEELIASQTGREDKEQIDQNERQMIQMTNQCLYKIPSNDITTEINVDIGTKEIVQVQSI